MLRTMNYKQYIFKLITVTSDIMKFKLKCLQNLNCSTIKINVNWENFFTDIDEISFSNKEVFETHGFINFTQLRLLFKL